MSARDKARARLARARVCGGRRLRLLGRSRAGWRRDSTESAPRVRERFGSLDVVSRARAHQKIFVAYKS